MPQAPPDINRLPCGLLSLQQDGIITWANGTLAHWLEYEPRKLPGMRIDQLLSPAARMFYLTSLLPLLQHHGHASEVYLRLRSRHGADMPMLINGDVTEGAGGKTRYDLSVMAIHKRHVFEEQLLSARQMAEQAVAEQEKAYAELELARQSLQEKQDELLALNCKLEHMATTDSLTGLANRRVFEQTLSHQLAVLERNQTPVSLVLMDVDHFKQVNDTHGHPVGDAVLQAVATTLKDNIREIDVAARIGGEEFVVIMPDTELEEAVVVGERLRERIAAMTDTPTPVTVSSGVAEAVPAEDVSDVFVRADSALYQAKADGRNRLRKAAAPAPR
ncbi:GGDEF domain-containing protein [Marinobacter bryozoorum]|uniref:sensor domain-containing diguanylate cyclase n=1 Tax=Marinobacter bryozoorum TaxID=256324 RepID=UPI0020051EEF|nr:GGDEF domain-containing protein [Marinobacter bryozoorum]MCK7542723.1 GGDEF domain-containing protein [Marinobacter bryozoorum]